ncbi:hypothetical protein [Streptomyces sp. NPDC003642]
MYSIVVVPPPTTEDERDRTPIRCAPGPYPTPGAPDNVAHSSVRAASGAGPAAPPGEVTR